MLTHVGCTEVRPSKFVPHAQDGTPHNGLFLTKRCPANAVLALLFVVDVSTSAIVDKYKEDTEHQQFRWVPTSKWPWDVNDHAARKALWFPYSINTTTGVIGAAANSPSDEKKTKEPLLNSIFKTYLFKVKKDGKVQSYVVTAVISTKSIARNSELVVSYQTEADADTFKVTHNNPLPVISQ